MRWSKPPLELKVETRSGTQLRMIGVHAKSKAPYGARDPDEIMRIAIENRRKQLAQCVWLRGRVKEHLDAGDDLIVLGDFNDGPEDRSITESLGTEVESNALINVTGGPQGSLKYKQHWNYFDQIIVSSNLISE